jgi:hypothetical protein
LRHYCHAIAIEFSNTTHKIQASLFEPVWDTSLKHFPGIRCSSVLFTSKGASDSEPWRPVLRRTRKYRVLSTSPGTSLQYLRVLRPVWTSGPCRSASKTFKCNEQSAGIRCPLPAFLSWLFIHALPYDPPFFEHRSLLSLFFTHN